MMVTGTQAFPARSFKIRSFNCSSFVIPNGGSVELQKASNLLQSLLQGALINHSPRRFFIIEPSTNISLALEVVAEVDVTPICGSTNAYVLTFYVYAYSRGLLLDVVSEKTPKANLDGLSFEPEKFVTSLSAQIQTCFEAMVDKMAAVSSNVNHAEWHGQVAAIDQEAGIAVTPFQGAANDWGAQINNLFDIARKVKETVPSDDDDVFQTIATVIVRENDFTVWCKYYELAEPPKKKVKVGDRVYIHYL